MVVLATKLKFRGGGGKLWTPTIERCLYLCSKVENGKVLFVLGDVAKFSLCIDPTDDTVDQALVL